MKLTTTAAALALGAALFAGCSAVPPAPAPAPAAASAPAASPSPIAAQEFLARNNLAGLSAEQVIERLDASEEDRAAGPVGSVRPDVLVLTDRQGGTTTMPLADRFYLSFAPSVTKTHDCFNHNLSSCRGELAGQQVHVTITDAAGTALVDRDVTTYANGFAGLWLPRGLEGTITVTAQGRTATQALGTGPDDPTCLTTLKLT